MIPQNDEMLTSLDDTGRIADCSTYMERPYHNILQVWQKYQLLKLKGLHLVCDLCGLVDVLLFKRSLKNVGFGFLGKACVLLGNVV